MDRVSGFFEGLGERVAESANTGKGFADLRRVSALLKLTNACNSRCRYCQSWQDSSTVHLPLEWIASIVSCLTSCERARVVISGGEPSLSPVLPEALRLLSEARIPVILITNGLASGRDAPWTCGVDELTFSIDSTVRETYRAIRGVDGLGNALRSLGDAIRCRSGDGVPLVSVNIVLSKQALRDLSTTVQCLLDRGVRRLYFLPLETHLGMDSSLVADASDWEFFFSRIYPGVLEQLAEAGVSIPWWSFASVNAVSSISPSRCMVPWVQTVIRPNGDVYPCCRLGDDGSEQCRDRSYLMGSLSDESLESILWGQRARCVRATIANTNPRQCATCEIGSVFSLDAITGAPLVADIPGASCTLDYPEHIKV